jgi:hypothetical protein
MNVASVKLSTNCELSEKAIACWKSVVSVYSRRTLGSIPSGPWTHTKWLRVARQAFSLLRYVGYAVCVYLCIMYLCIYYTRIRMYPL